MDSEKQLDIETMSACIAELRRLRDTCKSALVDPSSQYPGLQAAVRVLQDMRLEAVRSKIAK